MSLTECDVSEEGGLHKATFNATRQQVQSPACERAASPLAIPKTCGHEKVG